MNARNFRIPIHAGGGDAIGFLSPTIHYNENPLSDDTQKTEGATNMNMDVDDAVGLQHGPMAVEDAVEDAADAAAIPVGDAPDIAEAVDATDDVDPSLSSSPVSSSPTVDHVETIGDNADDGGADVEMEAEEVEEVGGEEQEEAQDPLG